MKIRNLIPLAALALLLSACLPDLPPSSGTVSVSIEPAEARTSTFDWQISGRDLAGNPRELTGSCGSGCELIETELRAGSDWELRVSPPEPNPNTQQMGWVAAGPAEGEASADYVETFTLDRNQTAELTAAFRRINVLLWDTEYPENGPGTVTLTDLRTWPGADSYTIGALEASCTTQAAAEPMRFGLPEGTELTITDEPVEIELSYLDDPADTPIFGSATACTLSGSDSDNRPLGLRNEPIQPASN